MVWNTGCLDSDSIYPNAVYTAERGNAVAGYYNTTWTGKIALPYPSDYGYAAEIGQAKCNSTLGSYSNDNCKNTNWMLTLMGSSYGWFLTPYSGNSYNAWYWSSAGYVNGADVGESNGVFPVLYLSSEQVIEAGHTGKSSDSYVLSS